jgi:hypothetical protein
MVCLPKNKGGLGITNIAVHNEALLKFLHKFYNKEDIPWFNLFGAYIRIPHLELPQLLVLFGGRTCLKLTTNTGAY